MNCIICGGYPAYRHLKDLCFHCFTWEPRGRVIDVYDDDHDDSIARFSVAVAWTKRHMKFKARIRWRTQNTADPWTDNCGGEYSGQSCQREIPFVLAGGNSVNVCMRTENQHDDWARCREDMLDRGEQLPWDALL